MSQLPVLPGVSDDGSVTCRVDMHVKLLDGPVVTRAKRRGLDVLVYAPHFTRLPTIRKRAAVMSDDDLLVVPAREMFTGSWHSRKHVLAIGLEEPVPDFVTLEAAMSEFERQEAAVLAPHPEFATVSLDAADVREYDVDALETYNPKYLPWHSRRARAVARETGRPGFASSYAHLRGTVGEAWTAFDEPITDADDLVERLTGRVPRQVFHRQGLRHRLRGLAEFAHLGWENTWEKFDRTRSGMPPTHPGHAAYGGRFDDCRVYW